MRQVEYAKLLFISTTFAVMLSLGSSSIAYAGCFDEILSLLGVYPSNRFDLNTVDSNLPVAPIFNLKGRPRNIEVNGTCQNLTFGFDTEVPSAELLLFWSRRDKTGFESFIRTVMGQNVKIAYVYLNVIVSNIDPNSYINVVSGLEFDGNYSVIGSTTNRPFHQMFLFAPTYGALTHDPVLVNVPALFSSTVSGLINQYYYNNRTVVGIGFDTGTGWPELIYNPDKVQGPFEMDPAQFWNQRGNQFQKFVNSEFVFDRQSPPYPHDHVALPASISTNAAIGFSQIAETYLIMDRIRVMSASIANGRPVEGIQNLNQYFMSTQFATPTTLPGRGLVKLTLNRQTAGFTGQHDLELRIRADSTKANALGIIGAIVQNATMLQNVSPVQYVDIPNERIDPKVGNIQGMLRFFIASANKGNNQTVSAALVKIKAGVDAYYAGLTTTPAAFTWPKSIFDSPAGVKLMANFTDLVTNNLRFFTTVSSYLLGN